MKRLLSFCLCLLLISCFEDKDDNLDLSNLATPTFRFTQNWDGTDVSIDDLITTQFTNAHGETLNISNLRYLISKIVFENADGDIFILNGYQLVDLSDPSTSLFSPEGSLPEGLYTLKFVYGFNEMDNIDGAYPELNSVSWNWPQMLGGGYHFLQMDGMFNVDTTIASPYNYHHGTAKLNDTEFEQNFVNFEFTNSIFISHNTEIEIQFNLAELFKNPNLWDLNQYSSSLMPNYDAQKMMQQNAATAFSIGQVTN
ncbi:MbnP family protein [Mangrovimonas futianensis]|uniref:MbnP family protein n=1 Tax=Mangrovimonas futianensis TaxID=2895523 RepID=UPI001E438633|nr:MbnP family protein [Mangrovimonas futianensis]MCF1420636.1 hypothetical protein [Mangrovimonas futianensis]